MCSGLLPTFLVNGEVYTPGLTDNVIIKNGRVCLKNVTNHLHYLEVCHKRRSFCPSNEDSEFIITKRGQIEVTTLTGEKTCISPLC